MNKNIKIGNHIISENSPVFCIGELSCNHLNNYELAMKTICDDRCWSGLY